MLFFFSPFLSLCAVLFVYSSSERTRLSAVAILSADDWVFIFALLLLLLFWMKCSAQYVTGWVVLGLVFKRFPLCEFSLFDTP